MSVRELDKRIDIIERALRIKLDPRPDLSEILDGTDEEVEAYFDKLMHEIRETNPAALERWEYGKKRRMEMEAQERDRLLAENL